MENNLKYWKWDFLRLGFLFFIFNTFFIWFSMFKIRSGFNEDLQWGLDTKIDWKYGKKTSNYIN